jgi:hypothetical protein
VGAFVLFNGLYIPVWLSWQSDCLDNSGGIKLTTKLSTYD